MNKFKLIFKKYKYTETLDKLVGEDWTPPKSIDSIEA
jgi:hypothetical protein